MPWLSPVQDALPPVPLLDSSDALDVVVAAPPRGPRASSVAVSGVASGPPVTLFPIFTRLLSSVVSTVLASTHYGTPPVGCSARVQYTVLLKDSNKGECECGRERRY